MTVDAWPRAFPESFTEPGSTGVSASPAVRGGARDNPPFDLVFVDDAARAVLLALESPVGDRVYNIAAGIEGSAERVREEIGWKPGTSLEQGLDAVLPVSVS
jgi:nucleoside-diphosphate-sugar epimerase